MAEIDNLVHDGREMRVQMAKFGRPDGPPPSRGGGGYDDRGRGGGYGDRGGYGGEFVMCRARRFIVNAPFHVSALGVWSYTLPSVASQLRTQPTDVCSRSSTADSP